MPLLSLVQAVNDALKLEMRRNPDLVVLGEDVGRLGGVFRATAGLQEEFGPGRVVDTPLSEGGIIGAAIGMALYGLKPVPEIQFADFLFPAMDQLVNELAKLRYRSGGQYAAPMVIRAPYGGTGKGGLYHSQSPEALFIHTAGLKVVVPSSPYDAKGLLLAALRQPDPILFFEPKRLYRSQRQEVPEGDYTVELGKAQVLRPGHALTVIAWGAMIHEAEAATAQALAQGIDCELIDLRTLWPLDIACVQESVRKTGRALIVHEAPRTCGLGAELVALIQERCFLSLEAPVRRVTGWDTPFPYALEQDYLPRAPRILQGIQETVAFQA
ncbi:alpha-ketoacid dehydrogenase subunit beta [Stigmatella hybrida]|uniref:alpha-ketoacid dehydrogenase subunit beta n=1 Tax=Stigmatella hybrida TaxID=394097 RepID=UPI001CDB0F3D|nr:alpha-ketoacid dehydrogenase subunit beta [Stigmatella hybrida]